MLEAYVDLKHVLVVQMARSTNKYMRFQILKAAKENQKEAHVTENDNNKLLNFRENVQGSPLEDMIFRWCQPGKDLRKSIPGKRTCKDPANGLCKFKVQKETTAAGGGEIGGRSGRP